MRRYSTAKKEKLVERIGRLKSKQHYLKVFEIIQKKKKYPVKHLGDSTVMFFHDLDSSVYCELEEYLDTVLAPEEKKNDSEMTEEYKPYSQDEFPDEKTISPKLKYSNREKNLIKRKRYDQTLNEENGSDITYCEFDISNLSETRQSD